MLNWISRTAKQRDMFVIEKFLNREAFRPLFVIQFLHLILSETIIAFKIFFLSASLSLF